WYVGTSQVTGAVAAYSGGDHAVYTSTPAATDEILLDPNPIHGDGTTGGGICTFGIFCSAVPGANRGLADVFEVHVDPAGGANVTWTKDLGGRRIFFACQSSGASAFAGTPDLNGCYGPAEMSITKTDSPDPVGPGQTLTYHLTVTNNGVAGGPSTTSGVTVTDTLPAGVTLASATASTGSCSGTTTISCALGIFPGGASATIDLVGTVSASAGKGMLTNSATASALTADPERVDGDRHDRRPASVQEGDDHEYRFGVFEYERPESGQQLRQRYDGGGALRVTVSAGSSVAVQLARRLSASSDFEPTSAV